MIRIATRWHVLVLAPLALLGCKREPPKVTDREVNAAPPASPIVVGSAGGSGSASGATGSGGVSTEMSALVESVVADTLVYAEKMAPIIHAFDGNCDAHADRLMQLEPLVTSIRARSARLQRDPSALVLVKELLGARKKDELAKIDAQLVTLGTTREALDKQEAEIRSTCGTNDKVNAAMAKVGLFRKSTGNAPPPPVPTRP